MLENLRSEARMRSLFRLFLPVALLVGTSVRSKAQYCIPYSSTCWEWINNVTLNTINNTSAYGCGITSPGYSNYTTISTSMLQGNTYTISVIVGTWYYSDIVGVWMDWDQNTTFDNTEFFALSNSGAGSFTGAIAVPPSATLGSTRMRVRLQDGTEGPLDPCQSLIYGEAEDYTITVTANTCTADFTATAPFSQTQNTTSATQTCSFSSAGDHVWAVTISCAGTWTISTCSANTLFDTEIHLGSNCCSNNLATNDNGCGTSSQITTYLTAGTYYVTVEGSGTATGQYALSVTGGPSACYCGAGGVNPTEYISNVNMGSIYNTSGWSGYGNYTALSTIVYVGNTYNLTVTKFGGNLLTQCRVWIDWNIDNDFTDPGEELTVGGSPSAGPYPVAVAVPVTATLGTTRLRIRITNSYPAQGSCGYGSYEVEDYSLIVQAACPVDYTVSAPYTSGTVPLGATASNCGYSTSPDHVYQVTIPCTGDWTFSLCNTATNFDTWIAVGTGCCNSSLGTNDNYCGTASQITLTGLAAGTYFVTVYGQGNATGNYELTIFSTPICYCPAAGTGGNNFIDDVTLGTINNLNTGASPGGYGNYTGISTTLLVGQSYSMTVDDNPANSFVDSRLDGWIDWNANGSFADPGDQLVATSAPAPFTVPVTPPSGTLPGSKRMRLRLSLVTNGVSPCGVSGYEVEDYTITIGTPPNDECTGATGIYALTVYQPCTSPAGQTSANATNSGIPPAAACTGTLPDDDVWYSFVAPTGGSVTIEISASAGYDPVVELFTGSCSVPVSLQCQNANGTGGPETLTQTGLTAGNTYYFRVYHAGAGSGTSDFAVCISQPPANDAACTPTSLVVSACGAVPVAGSSTAATSSGFVATCGGTADDDVWYSFTATNTSHNITVIGSSGFNAVVELMTNVCTLPVNMDCENSTGTGQIEILSASGLTVGTTYLIRVYHFGAGWGTGSFSIMIGAGNYFIGTGTSFNASTTYPSPYANLNYDTRQQYLVRASEILATGATAGDINSIAWDVVTTNAVGTFEGFTIKMKHTTKTQLTEFDNYNLKTVFGPTNLTISGTGWINHNFGANAFCWDGASNIIIETCFDDPANNTTSNASCRYTTTSFPSAVRSHTNLAPAIPNVCYLSYVSGGGADRPNMRFNICPQASGSRDAEMLNILTLPFVNSGSSVTVTCEFANNSCSANPLTSATLEYRWNGGTWVSQAWSGNLAVGAKTTFSFTTPFTATPVGFYNLDVRIQNANGLGADDVPSNDLKTLAIHVRDASVTPAPTTWAGTDFWWSFPVNAFTVMVNGNTDPRLWYIDLLSPYCATVTVEMPLLNYSTIASLTPNVTTTLVLPDMINGQRIFQEWDGISNKGMHITSDSAITVYAIAYINASVDGEAIMPTSTLGKSYVLQHRNEGQVAPNLVTVVATEPGTTQVRVNYWNGSGTKSSTTVNLSQSQTYRLTMNHINCREDNKTDYSNLCMTSSGATVMASKPVVVLSHTECTRMMPCGACDVMFVQHMPYENWGTEYITSQAIDRGAPDGVTCTTGVVVSGLYSTGDFIEIIGPLGTQVTINNRTGGQVYTIASPWYGNYGFGHIWYENPPFGALPTDPEYFGEANTIITANNPIQIVQYGKGYRYDVSDRGPNTDPEAIMLFPTSTWSDEWLISTLNTLTAAITAVVIVAPNVTVGGAITLDGVPIGPVGWTQIGSTSGSYVYRRVPMTPAAHRVVHPGGTPFGLYLDAVGQAESYIVQGGHYPLVPPHQCTLLPLSDVILSGVHQDGVNHLVWVSSSEMNRARYVIERSTDGTNYSDIATLNAFTGSAGMSYEYDDFEPNPGANYYRVRVINADELFDYTNVVKLEFHPSQLGVTLVPNPASSEVTITLEASAFGGGPLEMTVSNAFGQVLSRSVVHAPATGSNSAILDVSDFASGLYYFNFKGEGVDKMVKLMVTH